jgi:hypothetical protein
VSRFAHWSDRRKSRTATAPVRSLSDVVAALMTKLRLSRAFGGRAVCKARLHRAGPVWSPWRPFACQLAVALWSGMKAAANAELERLEHHAAAPSYGL